MYFSASAGGGFHTWRQRFPDGVPEKITSGPSEEEGIAMAPDGRWLVTAVGQRQRSVSLHSPNGDRQISLEGYAYNPKFTPDFKTLFYRVLKGSQPSSDPTELWMADLNSGRNELFLPGFSLAGPQPYAISPDGSIVVFSFRDQGSPTQLWVAPLDRRSPPRPIPNGEGDWPLFGPKGEIYFRGADGFAYRIWSDGSERHRVIDQPILYTRGVSPDGEWLAVAAVEPTTKTRADLVFPLKGGSPNRIWGKDSLLRWSPDGKFVFLPGSMASGGAGAFGRNYVFPLAPGKMLPDIPPGGFRTEAEVVKYPGVRVIEVADIAPGPAPDVYAFSKETSQRNLFRIPLR
jgi:Tol biopolymer transport system component